MLLHYAVIILAFHTILFILFVYVSVLGVMFLARLTCAFNEQRNTAHAPLHGLLQEGPFRALGCAGWPLKQAGQRDERSCPPGEASRGPRWALSVLCSTTVLRSTSCLGVEWGRRVLNIRATNPTPESYRRNIINACSLYKVNSGCYECTRDIII